MVLVGKVCSLNIFLPPFFLVTYDAKKEKKIFHREFFCYVLYLMESFVGSHGLLKQGNAEYDAKRQQLYEYYHPLEFSPTIGLEDKTKLMEEW